VIQADTGLSTSQVCVLSGLPLPAFAAAAAVAPRLAGQFGLERSLFGAVAVSMVGIIIRSLPTSVALFGGTALLGIGIGCSNVLLLGLIKRDFPRHIEMMTATYATTAISPIMASDGLHRIAVFRFLRRRHLATDYLENPSIQQFRGWLGPLFVPGGVVGGIVRRPTARGRMRDQRWLAGTSATFGVIGFAGFGSIDGLPLRRHRAGDPRCSARRDTLLDDTTHRLDGYRAAPGRTIAA